MGLILVFLLIGLFVIAITLGPLRGRIPDDPGLRRLPLVFLAAQVILFAVEVWLTIATSHQWLGNLIVLPVHLLLIITAVWTMAVCVHLISINPVLNILILCISGYLFLFGPRTAMELSDHWPTVVSRYQEWTKPKPSRRDIREAARRQKAEQDMREEAQKKLSLFKDYINQEYGSGWEWSEEKARQKILDIEGGEIMPENKDRYEMMLKELKQYSDEQRLRHEESQRIIKANQQEKDGREVLSRALESSMRASSLNMDDALQMVADADAATICQEKKDEASGTNAHDQTCRSFFDAAGSRDECVEKEYYPSGYLKSAARTVNAVRDGRYMECEDGGILRSSQMYKSGLLIDD